MLMLAVIIAGCGAKQTQDAKFNTSQVAVIDMEKAIKSHSKYNKFFELENQANEIRKQLQTDQLEKANQLQFSQFSSDASDKGMVELGKVAEQEFNAKMAAKQAELNPRLTNKAEEIRLNLSRELEEYKVQIDKEYQPQIFNVELKLKTLQLTKEEGTLLQSELEGLRSKRFNAINLKSEQLAGRMDELMAPEKAAIEEELSVYAKELNHELSKQIEVKRTEMLARKDQIITTQPQLNEKQEQLLMKQQEIEALQEYIIENIREKAAKVAADNGYEAVVAHVAVNINAVDITSMVIAECNK